MTQISYDRVVLCGHGSGDSGFNIDFLKFVKKIRENLKNLNVDYCFIEKNRPSIKNYLSEFNYDLNRLIFVPALLFKGNHFNNDIKKKIINYKKDNISPLVLDSINIEKELLNIYIKKLKTEIIKGKENILVTVATKSSNRIIRESLSNYTLKLSKGLGIKSKKNFLLGDKDIHNQISISNSDRFHLILHPIFLFGGHLYNKITNDFSQKYTNIHITQPLAKEKNVIKIFTNLIESKIKIID